jgi:hypothetical protein
MIIMWKDKTSVLFMPAFPISAAHTNIMEKTGKRTS